ncbi:F-box protein At1g61340 [Linum grandiflorum]
MALGKKSVIRSGMKRKRGSSEEDIKKADHLQNLPEELLVKVICGVNYPDLKNLLRVSRQMAESTLIAKEVHFNFTTPMKVVQARPEMKTAPSAPRALQQLRKRLTAEDASDLAVSLFASLP